MNIKLPLLYFLLPITLILPQTTSAAELYFKSNGVSQDGAFILDVFAHTDQKNPFNVAAANIIFDPTVFDISAIDISESIFSLWTTKPSQSQPGHIEFGGGTPAHGGFIWSGKLFTLYLMPNQYGSTSFEFENAHILSADGEGEDILKGTRPFNVAHEAAIPRSYDTDRDGTVSIEELSIGLST